MADAGLSREQGNSLVATMSKMIQQTHPLSANEREAYKDAENEKLEKLFGDKWHDELRPAARMIDELDRKRPGLKEFVRAHGDNALFIMQLVQAARIYDKRKGRWMPRLCLPPRRAQVTPQRSCRRDGRGTGFYCWRETLVPSLIGLNAHRLRDLERRWRRRVKQICL